jgi:hypothetical protein
LKEWDFPWLKDTGQYHEHCDDCVQLMAKAHEIGGDDLASLAETLFLVGLGHEEIAKDLPFHSKDLKSGESS